MTPSPVYGPPNPFDPATVHGRQLIRRRNIDAVPTNVDRWLDACRGLWASDDPRLMSTEMFPEEMVCEVTMEYQPLFMPEPGSLLNVQWPVWTLFITLVLPESAGERAHLHRSPRGILERCSSANRALAPEWLRTMYHGQTCTFSQPRCMAADMFAMLAMTSENITLGYSPAMLSWASSISLVHRARRAVRRHPGPIRGSGDGLRRSSRVHMDCD